MKLYGILDNISLGFSMFRCPNYESLWYSGQDESKIFNVQFMQLYGILDKMSLGFLMSKL